MVVKIHKSHGSTAGTLKYNQDKVKKGNAEILGVYNMEGESFRDFQRVFDAYERRNIRTEKTSFQLSINPNPGNTQEALTNDEMMNYAKKLMDGLGYGKQPILIYKHHDIDRTHYHVVSIRTNEQGRKIKDSFEKENLQRLMARYAKQYHYQIGNDNSNKKKSAAIRESLPRFNPSTGNVRQQYKEIFDEAMTYDFRTFNQFQTIIHSMGVNVEFSQGDDYHVVFEGLDKRGNNASPRISEIELEEDLYNQVKEKLDAPKEQLTKEEKKAVYTDRFRVGKAVAFCLEKAETERHFAIMLSRMNITVGLSKTENGDVFGATFIDHESKTAFKASELKKELSFESLKETARPETGRWAVREKQLQEEWVAKKKEERRDKRIQRNMHLAALQGGPLVKCPEDFISRASYTKETDYIDTALNILKNILLIALGQKPVLSRNKPFKKKSPWDK